MTANGPDTATPAWFVWSWWAALRGLLFALPAAVAMPFDLRTGLALGVGVLPVVAVPLAPRRRRRIVVVFVGLLMAVSVMVGAALATTPWLAVAGIFLMAVGAAALAMRRPAAKVLMTLAVPLTAVGFSYEGLAAGAPLAVLFVAGSVYGWLVTLLPWPPSSARHGAASDALPTLGYGVRLGLAGALCAAIGFALGFDHVGWAAAAALLVMRPSTETLRLRALGRPVSVCVGALAAITLLQLQVPVAVVEAAVVLVVIVATGTVGSRWYVMPAFTTFFVFLLLLSNDLAAAAGRFDERVGETLLGVAVALGFGQVVPDITRRRRSRATRDGPGIVTH